MSRFFDILQARVSTRTYDGTPLGIDAIREIGRFIETPAEGPFGGSVRFALLSGSGQGRVKMGTYGLIANVPAFLVGAVRSGRGANEDFGYSMESVVLEATRLGLGTCWIGGLFDRGRAAAALGSRPGEIIPAVCAVGNPAVRRSVADRIVAGVAGSRSRRAFGELFFEGPASTPMDASPGDPVVRALEAVRIAPSASNKQPWRIVRTKGGAGSPGACHFYLDEDRNYNRLFGEIRLQNLDMGIAMRHFDAACSELGLGGRWRLPGAGTEEPEGVGESLPGAPPPGRKGWIHIASWEFR